MTNNITERLATAFLKAHCGIRLEGLNRTRRNLRAGIPWTRFEQGISLI
jgi:hypothetical protein